MIRPGHPAASRRSRRGIVLVVILMILVLLAIMGVSLLQLSVVEKRVSRSYTDTVRARLVARAGIEKAISEINQNASLGRLLDPSLRYWGRNLTERGAPDDDCPLAEALNPSFALEEEGVQNPADREVRPLLIKVDDVRIGLSGTMSSSAYAPNGDIYRLRVSDCNSRIHVNDGLEGGPNGTVSQNLRRILDSLGAQTRVADLGARIVAHRPVAGYRSRRELEAQLGHDDYAKVGRFLTTEAWVNRNVVNPVPLSRHVLESYPVPYNAIVDSFRYGPSRDMDGNLLHHPLLFAPEHADPQKQDHAVMALDEINAQWIERTARAPVNVNEAPKEVLVALISGLRGFFLVGRRKLNPEPGLYSFLIHPRYDYAPGRLLGDELGFLYSTLPFVGPGDTKPGISAVRVAEEIIACRTRQPSPHCGIGYAGAWYGGPFRSWRQFHAFCDGLVAGGLLRDTRDIFFDYQAQPAGGGWWGGTTGSDDLDLSVSPLQREAASQALADVLKANFNPNLTLNELNPDHNLHLLVDKTDLLCNSTEFCFFPMGVFEIESEGLILATKEGKDLLAGREATVVARRRIASIVQVYDVMIETAQSDFSLGEGSRRPGGTPATNSNRTVEIGPEPDNGNGPAACRWSGWVQLATNGGPWRSLRAGHTPGEKKDTPRGSGERGAVALAHYRYDHRLDYHASKAEAILKASAIPNHPDRTETSPGPYGPAEGFLLARDFQLGPPDPGTTSPPPGERLPPFAVSDLRIDGAYVERDSALQYLNTPQVFGTIGTVAYWVKPSFEPESTSRPRTFFSMDIPPAGSSGMAPFAQVINGQWFFPSHDMPAGTDSQTEPTFPTYWQGPWRPVSMTCGYSTLGGWGGGVGCNTPSLNHRGHPTCRTSNPNPDPLRRNRWIHIAYHWNMAGQQTRLFINGAEPGNMGLIHVHPGGSNVGDYLQGNTPFRIGEPGSFTIRNWAADATIDEFHMWKSDALDPAALLFSQGRYFRPRGTIEARFRSRDLQFPTHPRQLAPPAALAESGSPAAKPPEPVLLKEPIRVLCAAWTWHPEETTIDGRTVAVDASGFAELDVRLGLRFYHRGERTGPLHEEEGGSAVGDIVCNPDESIQYEAVITIPKATLDTILLGTPVLDDVTLVFSRGATFLQYHLSE